MHQLWRAQGSHLCLPHCAGLEQQGVCGNWQWLRGGFRGGAARLQPQLGGNDQEEAKAAGPDPGEGDGEDGEGEEDEVEGFEGVKEEPDGAASALASHILPESEAEAAQGPSRLEHGGKEIRKRWWHSPSV